MFGLLFTVGLANAGAAPAPFSASDLALDSVHLEHARLELGRTNGSQKEARSLLLPGDPPDAWVYGYLPYWANNLNTVAWDSLTHVAVFDVGVDSSGNLTRTSNWTGTAEKVLNKATYRSIFTLEEVERPSRQPKSSEIIWWRWKGTKSV